MEIHHKITINIIEVHLFNICLYVMNFDKCSMCFPERRGGHKPFSRGQDITEHSKIQPLVHLR